MEDKPDRGASRRSLVEHPQWVLESIARVQTLLGKAADAVLADDLAQAKSLADEADDPRLSEWFHFSVQVPTVLYPSLGLDHKTFRRPPGKKVRQNVKSATLREMWTRDNFQCRYCEIPILLKQARDCLRSEAGLRWGRSNLSRHGCMVIMASHDHVVPHAWGGTDEIENLVTACWPCQFAKSSFLLDDLGLLDPRLHEPGDLDWDGLGRILT